MLNCWLFLHKIMLWCVVRQPQVMLSVCVGAGREDDVE